MLILSGISIGDAVSIANAILILSGFIFTAIQIRQSKKIHQETLDWNRKIATIEAMDRRSTLDFCDMERLLDLRNCHETIPLEKLDSVFQENPLAETGVIRYLNYYSFLALNAENGVFDRKMIMRSRGAIIGRSIVRFEEYIQRRRTLNGLAGTWKGLERFAKTTSSYKRYLREGSFSKVAQDSDDSAPKILGPTVSETD